MVRDYPGIFQLIPQCPSPSDATAQSAAVRRTALLLVCEQRGVWDTEGWLGPEVGVPL